VYSDYLEKPGKTPSQYSQLVWAETYQFGCGQSFTSDESLNTYYFICYYYPPVLYWPDVYSLGEYCKPNGLRNRKARAKLCEQRSSPSRIMCSEIRQLGGRDWLFLHQALFANEQALSIKFNPERSIKFGRRWGWWRPWCESLYRENGGILNKWKQINPSINVW
jgi:hypothetical protein